MKNHERLRRLQVANSVLLVLHPSGLQLAPGRGGWRVHWVAGGRVHSHRVDHLASCLAWSHGSTVTGCVQALARWVRGDRAPALAWWESLVAEPCLVGRPFGHVVVQLLVIGGWR